MKIVTLNIRAGGGKRIDLLLSRLKTYGADTIVLTEFRCNKNAERMKQELASTGFIHQSYNLFPPKVNSVIICSKHSFENVDLPELPDECSNRLLLIKFPGFYLAGVYFAQRKEKKYLFDYIINKIVPVVNGMGIVIGDFNTGLPFIDEKGCSFYCIDYFRELGETLIDSWRIRNTDKSEYSWYSNKNNGFRIDHAFCTKGLNEKITQISYDHLPRLKKETDHSALILKME